MTAQVFIDYAVEGGVAVITLNRPEQRNAQNREFLQQLDAAWDRAAMDPQVRVIVLKAMGPHFSTGHDLTTIDGHCELNWARDGISGLYAYERQYFVGLSRKWRDIPKPSIAAVQGKCIAAGLMLCWPCDLIMAAENAEFSDPVVLMGIGGVEYHGHTWELGPRKAKEMLFRAKPVNAQDAFRLGMVNHVYPLESLVEETMKVAAEIAQMEPFGLAMAKRAVNQTLDIQGQYSAIQTVFDIHTIGHGNALGRNLASGEGEYAVLMGLDGMKNANKRT